MKEVELLARLSRGEILGLGEWRTGRVEAIKYTNTKTNQQENRVVVRHGLEMGDNQVSVVQWCSPGTVLESVKVPYRKGTKVLLVVSRIAVEKGVKTLEAEMLPDGEQPAR